MSWNERGCCYLQHGAEPVPYMGLLLLLPLLAFLHRRPPNAQEIAERAPQVIQCNETLREVTLYQNINGKQMSRTFRYDKVCA